MKRMNIFYFVALVFLGLQGVVNGAEKMSLLKNGVYKNVGLSAGYYYYGEVDRRGDFVMRMDTAPLGVFGSLGKAYENGLKLDALAEINASIGLYTGAVLDTSNANRDGQSLQTLIGNTFIKGVGRVGYDVLKSFSSASLYLQSGFGYYFNWTNFLSIPRLQGYAYIPLEVEGQVALSEKLALDYALGYNLFLFGNHYTNGYGWGYSGALDTTQTKGLGGIAKVGFSFFNKDGEKNSFGVIYEFWSVEGSNPARLTDYTGKDVALYEPKNTSHIVRFYYSWDF
ncbi:hypothetical protein CQA49_05260 [Helicobacter sp. MIT 00-7814]|uniref:hypothetical protein n=1 Tax=unclassified Helicobacter TaxID=2593540 RepID=UPI000E1F6B7D|nr:MULTISPECIES: hypothetical protein [unclassified Helicobacter]RDU54197.1 hypothetical protein CQA49_05260 [Helicobacter sp. MIT 00-7814]RDU56057.1 hypothetical protein CQA37_03160 [Helicobacter sp. MIT 99-10781]